MSAAMPNKDISIFKKFREFVVHAYTVANHFRLYLQYDLCTHVCMQSYYLLICIFVYT